MSATERDHAVAIKAVDARQITQKRAACSVVVPGARCVVPSNATAPTTRRVMIALGRAVDEIVRAAADPEADQTEEARVAGGSPPATSLPARR